MDENLHYLLHEELEGLFDLPAAKAAQVASEQAIAMVHAASREALEHLAEPVSMPAEAPAPAADGDELIERFLRPDVLDALTKLAGVSPEQVLTALAKLVGVQPQQVLGALVKRLGAHR
ncbi:hypothetical protein [Lysobacter sp. CA196]|uniref:hypothetical protein n=1 Tax=Lysobacter sp. CA196 TaxID=3455606 RepID=UPI003F8D7031